VDWCQIPFSFSFLVKKTSNLETLWEWDDIIRERRYIYMGSASSIIFMMMVFFFILLYIYALLIIII